MRVFGVLAGLFALGTVAYFVVGLLDISSVRTYHSTSSYAVVSTLELHTGDASVDVVPDGTGRIVVDVETRRGLQSQDFNATERDDALVLSGGCQQAFGFLCHTKITVHTPAQIAIRGNVLDGDVTATGIAGSIDLTAGDGDLRLGRTSGPMQVHSGDGDVDLSNISTDALTLRMGDGDVDASLATAPTSIEVHTGDGDVDVCLPRSAPPYAVTVHHGDGTLDDQVPSDPRAANTLSVDAGDGDITLRLC
jgi:Putative adhesin